MSWETSGNAGTNPPGDFIGTTDNKALVIKTNNIPRMQIDSTPDGSKTTLELSTSTPSASGTTAAPILTSETVTVWGIAASQGSLDLSLLSSSRSGPTRPTGLPGFTLPGGATSTSGDSPTPPASAKLQITSTKINITGDLNVATALSAASAHVTGDVTVDGDVILTGGADCAEDFDIVGAGKVDPGTVMVLDQNGALQQSQYAYDRKVAGVISGAGEYKPAITLDKQKGSRKNRLPLALMGKVFCKVDAQYGAVEVGDLLTTSPTAGCAMKARDASKAFGAVIGKALRPLQSGQGLIPILVALQ